MKEQLLFIIQGSNWLAVLRAEKRGHKGIVGKNKVAVSVDKTAYFN